jgi:hypothetical protein
MRSRRRRTHLVAGRLPPPTIEGEVDRLGRGHDTARPEMRGEEEEEEEEGERKETCAAAALPPSCDGCGGGCFCFWARMYEGGTRGRGGPGWEGAIR